MTPASSNDAPAAIFDPYVSATSQVGAYPKGMPCPSQVGAYPRGMPCPGQYRRRNQRKRRKMLRGLR